MATGLEFYKNETRTPANFTGAYSTFLTCTANRTGKAGAKNFFIICHISTTVDNVGTLGMVRLQVDSTDYGECADGLTHGDVSPHGYTYNFVKRLSLDNSSHSITLDCGRVSGVNNFIAENASIVVLEESANAQYAEKEVEEGTGATTTYVNYLTLSFQPSITENYLIINSCETKCEDESDSGVFGIFFRHNVTALLFEGWGKIVGAVNDNIYRTVGGAYHQELSSAASQDLKIEMYGGGVDAEVYCRKGYIIAIPFSDFENVYSDSQEASTFHTTSQSNTLVVLASQACNAANHLVIAGAQVSNESPTDVGFAHLISAGPVDFPAYNLDDRDEDNWEFYVNFLVHGVTLVAGNYDFEIEGDSTSDSYKGAVDKSYLTVCEIPAIAPPPSYIPKVIMVTCSPMVKKNGIYRRLKNLWIPPKNLWLPTPPVCVPKGIMAQ